MQIELTSATLIQQLNHVFRSIRRINWVLSSGFHLSLAGLLGLAAFGLAVRDGRLNSLHLLTWSSVSQDRPEKLRFLPGLQNLGNNCFLNVILQALASCVFFQPFLRKIIEDCQQLAVEEPVESLPLTVALAALLEELCPVDQRRIVLSPRKVMLAMAYYIPNFNLTSQQDAAEALLHLLSSLREEYLDCCHLNSCSLINVSASNCKILMPMRDDKHSELKRWQRDYLRPFDGILGSILTCRSCSSQISLSFETFYILPLSPVLDRGSSIIIGCTLEGCIKQFVAAEQVENYHCSCCWHNAAVKYLSSIGETDIEIEKIQTCTEQDSCDCRRLFHLQKLPWSNKFSRTLKQLTITRSPQILCIHLKRAAMNVFGETVKLQGHISFPLNLDLFPFMTIGVGIKDLDESPRRGPVRPCGKLSQDLNFYKMQLDTGKLNHIYGPTVENFSGFKEQAEDFWDDSSSPKSESCSKTICTDVHIQSDDKVGVMSQSVPREKTCLYKLVSVVSHFGRAGTGHYTIYRSVQDDDAHQKNIDAQDEGTSAYWFCISDSDVRCVSEKEVFEAEATLLFYEKILED